MHLSRIEWLAVYDLSVPTYSGSRVVLLSVCPTTQLASICLVVQIQLGVSGNYHLRQVQYTAQPKLRRLTEQHD